MTPRRRDRAETMDTNETTHTTYATYAMMTEEGGWSTPRAALRRRRQRGRVPMEEIRSKKYQRVETPEVVL